MLEWLTILSLDVCVLLCCVFFLAKYYLYKKWSVLEQWGVPHDRPTIRDLGHVRKVFTPTTYTYELECKRKFGPIWGFYMMTVPHVFVHDPDILRRILIKDFSNFQNRQRTRVQLEGKQFGSGIIQAVDSKWKRARVTLGPTFSSAKLKQMFGIMNWCIDNTMKVFENTAEGHSGIFHAKDIFSRLSLDIICSTAFGTDVNSQDQTKEEPTISRAAKEFFKKGLFSNIGFFIGTSFPSLAPLITRIFRRNRKPIGYLRNVCLEIMQRRRDDQSEGTRVDLLQLMLSSKISQAEAESGKLKGLTPDEIIGNSMTMLLAGYETTGTSMLFLAYNLATHPDVQSKLQDEIDDMFADGSDLDFDQINGLKYLDMCVNESLRLYCPVPRTVRTAANEITIKGFNIPRDCAVNIPIYTMCHDPEFWDDPMEYRPERMEDMSKIDNMVFLPFGGGPRNCIGYKFAITEIKLAFCRILHQFTIESCADTPKPPLEMTFAVTARPTVEFDLRVVRRS